MPFDQAVFINCPFDKDYAPLLEAALFCLVYVGLTPRLASESLEAGQNRLDKIIDLIRNCKYSIHDLSRCKSLAVGEFARMNMPFELGIDVGFRRSGVAPFGQKRFLIFEKDPYDLKRSISDIAGQDVAPHNNDFQVVIRKVRDFLRVEAGANPPGPSRLVSDYASCLGWMTEKKIAEGHSEEEALMLPTQERLDEMVAWVAQGRPAKFVVP